MKPRTKTKKFKVIDGFIITPGLEEKYANQPFFLEKEERANEFIKKHGLPNELTRDKSTKEKTSTE